MNTMRSFEVASVFGGGRQCDPNFVLAGERECTSSGSAGRDLVVAFTNGVGQLQVLCQEEFLINITKGDKASCMPSQMMRLVCIGTSPYYEQCIGTVSLS